jgi:polyhydroxyalkanoate synthesis regulator phasin
LSGGVALYAAQTNTQIDAEIAKKGGFQTETNKEVTMIELLEKSLLTAVGAMTLTQKKAEELLQELREKMNISEDEGKAFLQKIQDAAAQNQEKLMEQAREEVKKTCERMGVVTAAEFDKLKKKVAQLEKKLK